MVAFLVGDGPTVFSSATLPAGGSLVSTNLRGVGGIPADARGVFAALIIAPQAATRTVRIDAADAPNNSTGSPAHHSATIQTSAHYLVPLGTGASTGKIKLSTGSPENITGVTVVATGYWR